MLAHPTSPVAISRSKVEPPLVSGQWVRRPRIESRLDDALTRSLTVVTAPAGHGKTSTLVAWLRTRNLDAAWITVDSRDTELTRFASHVAVALDRVAPGLAAIFFAFLTAPDRLAPQDLGEAFGETLYDLDRNVVLVLDDFHAAGNGAVAEFVTGLLHGAPRRLHIILSSRHKPSLPLSRLRTMGDVVELTGADFRFSPLETRDLLRLETGAAVAPEIAASIHAAVGGWPAAVRLVAMGQISSETVQPMEAAGDQHAQLLLDYLGEEVLTRLPASQRDLLLRASLVERFNEPLLNALAAVPSSGQLRRADLEQLRPLDLYREIPGLSETWFAYHPLFREAFRRELKRSMDAGAIAAVHRRAARWFADAGHTHDAVRHFLEAGDVSAAALLIESRVNEAFAAEDWKSVAAWLRLLPMSEILDRPELLLTSAWVAYLGGRHSRIAHVLETMRDPRYRLLANDEQRAELALIADPTEADPSIWITSAERAIALIPSHKRYRYGYAHMALGMALTTAGREEEALARLAAFTTRESMRIDAASIRGYFARILIFWQLGRLTLCEQTAADQLQLATMNALLVSAGWGTAFLGVVAHERGDLAQATRHFGTVIADVEQLHFDCVRESFFAQILCYEARGRQDEADRAISRLRELAIASETVHQLELVDSFTARTALIRGDLATAQRWLGASSPTLMMDDLKNIEHPLLTRIKVLIAVGTRTALVEAEMLLEGFVGYGRASHMALALLESLAVHALLCEAQGDHAAATRILKESLELAAPEGIVQRYAYLGPSLAPILRRLLAGPAPVHHARRVLDALEAVLAAQPESTRVYEAIRGELPATPLSNRELDVLRGLAQRLTNNEIGQALFISPITVKHHVVHICDKLGVSGRRAASDRAAELGLLT